MSEAVQGTLNRWRQAIDARLGDLPVETLEVPAPVRDAIRYSVSGGGKRMRGLLLMSAYEGAGGRQDASGLAAAIEVVHAYSLVHDDLPCMDNDSMRRGMPTTHRAHGVAVATVAGVAMVPLAVVQAVRAARELALDDREASRIVRELMRASGAGGMVGGQLADLQAENRTLSLEEMERIHQGKTGALIACALVVAGLAAQASDSAIGILAGAGHSLGLAFQIADDVLDATASSADLGKTAGIDAALAKSTYVSLVGVDEARRRAESLVEEAISRLEAVGLRTVYLDHLARFIVTRRS